MTKECSNCKYWKKEDRYNNNQDVRVCNKVEHYESNYRWSDDYESYKLIYKVKDILAFANDASGYSAWLLTRPTFYCNMWEKEND